MLPVGSVKIATGSVLIIDGWMVSSGDLGRLDQGRSGPTGRTQS
jgi:hypothetical protein